MQDLRKLNDKEFKIGNRPVVFMKHDLATENYQCQHCAYASFRTTTCPDIDEYCDKDLTSVWHFADNVLPEAHKSKAKAPEASVGKKYDAGKPMYALVPSNALEEVTKVLTAGALKYNEPLSEENWRKVDSPFFRYYSAAMRHMETDRRGEMIDVDKVNPDGSISKGTDCYHLACAIASLMFMLQLRIEANK